LPPNIQPANPTTPRPLIRSRSRRESGCRSIVIWH
jgi:hypothetical protein